MGKRYGYYKDNREWDDLFLVCDRNDTVVKVIIIPDYDDPQHEQRARKRAVRVCRWLNRRPPVRVRLDRILRRFDPTGNHETWKDGHGISDWLYGDWEAQAEGRAA